MVVQYLLTLTGGMDILDTSLTKKYRKYEIPDIKTNNHRWLVDHPRELTKQNKTKRGG